MLARSTLSRIVWLFLIGTSWAWAAPALKGPATANIGAPVTITFTGNTNPRNFITIVAKGAPEGRYDEYGYADASGKVELHTPTTPGDYEIRLLSADSPYPTLARAPLQATAVTASFEAPPQVAAGSEVRVKWTGPNNERDYIGIGNAEHPYIVYEYTRYGNPTTLRAPDASGDYELRYFLGNGDKVIATRKLTIGAVTASLQGPTEVVAGSTFAVTWKGPNNPSDYITIVPKGAGAGASGNYQYPSRGNPAELRAPLQAGEYELWYATGQSHTTLAKANIRITPAKQEPGKLVVTAPAAVASGGGIEIILDASGSMLQKIGGQRRIDIAKQTLSKLTSSGIPAGTPFALRVFGREVDSCQTDLDIPVSPLSAAAVDAKIKALEAKNNARTPIGASLEKVSSDLAAIKGERLVVLLTDGEETCGGDPAAAIAALTKAGTTVRVNIVGFAIEDPKLAVTFSHWASLGNGSYFDAKDAAGLSRALMQSLRPSFEVVTPQGQVIATGVTGGDPIAVMPGNYSVRIKGQTSRTQSVSIESKATATVTL
ncbi:vWA domain-containing protein [Peristeroidobacter agariperforans]|uniref:vWA domain-containing protein n=1 Tax=Peristeroidobacter agariperforans TaxID=268404 RepID=UPI00101C4463|nr:VWA domain-containing protein [Peristeroidobacter agariperforans]